MITNLLDANLLKAGQDFPIKKLECNLSYIAKNVCQELVTVHGERNRFIGPSEVRGEWDFEGVRRIIENLATNAHKYSFEQTPVTISINEINSEAVISVYNVGNAIPAEDQKILFHAFIQTNSARASNKTGWA